MLADKPFIAHISEDMTREQTLEDHLNGISKRSQEFASVFGAREIAGVIGLCHDTGTGCGACPLPGRDGDRMWDFFAFMRNNATFMIDIIPNYGIISL